MDPLRRAVGRALVSSVDASDARCIQGINAEGIPATKPGPVAFGIVSLRRLTDDG